MSLFQAIQPRHNLSVIKPPVGFNYNVIPYREL
jgi:hypothetical protein